jgi:hypothetical protein
MGVKSFLRAGRENKPILKSDSNLTRNYRRKEMTKFAKILFLSVIAVGLLAGPAMAANLYNSAGNAFSPAATSTAYKVAYEIYNESLGVSTIALRGAIQIDLTQPLVAQDTANLVISSGNADFNSAGATYKWALLDSVDAIIGYTPTAGLITANLPFAIITGVGAPASLFVVQWDDANANNLIDAGETIVRGAGMYLRPGIGATCTNNRTVQIGFTTPRETTAQPVNFAVIVPQFSGTGPSTSTLTAELNTDDDFRSFLDGSGPNVIGPFDIDETAFFSIVDTSIANDLWIAYASLSPVGAIGFTVNSVVGEPGADLFFNGNPCSANVADTSFDCSDTGVLLVGDHSLELVVDGVTSNEPTNWSLADVQIAVTTTGLKDLCIVVPTQSVGVWYGGLEAFVPFVKGSTDGAYDTYIVLFNRYDSDAKVYVSTFKDSGATPIMVATGQLLGKEVIPTDGRLVITAGDIQSFLAGQGISWNPADGVPVKFNIRVPSQTGTTSYTGTVVFPDFSGTVTNVNPFDPFVEGIVVSAYPGGQRTIPLKFKTFKQGMYGH